MLFSYSDRLLGRHETSGPNSQVCRAVGACSLVSMSKERRYEALSLLFSNSAFPNAMHRGTGGDSATWFYHMRISRSRRGTLACGGSMSRAAHKRAQLAIRGGGQAGFALNQTVDGSNYPPKGLAVSIIKPDSLLGRSQPSGPYSQIRRASRAGTLVSTFK